MNSYVRLPDWLDNYIFMELGATYHPKRQDAEHNKNSDVEGVKNYLGTYFPRSYCEVRCIAENLFGNEDYWSTQTDSGLSDKVINILDLGCGTGGDIVGLLSVLCKEFSSACFNIRAFDANKNALWYMSAVINAIARTAHRSIQVLPEKFEVNSESDFYSLADRIGDARFDYILCCKACNELWSEGIVKQPYRAVAETFSAKLKDYGIMLLLDVASLPDGCPAYLPIEMNNELNSFAVLHEDFCTLLPRPCAEHPECRKKCYMLKKFSVKHSRCGFWDESNVCYRIICRQELREEMQWNQSLRQLRIEEQMTAAGQNQGKAYIIHGHNTPGRRACPWFRTGEEADAFDINS